MEAEAKHDFQATAEDELSFPKQAILKVNNGFNSNKNLSYYLKLRYHGNKITKDIIVLKF